MLNIFLRDLKVNLKNFMSLYIFIAPLLFVFFINLFVPAANNTTVHLAVLEGENSEFRNYLEEVAEVSVLNSEEGLESRILEQDDVFGVKENKLILQGNEAGYSRDLAERIVASYAAEERIKINFHSLGAGESSLKAILVTSVLLFVTVIGGMLTTLNIVEEKQDKTIRAIQVTPLSNLDFLFGKSMLSVIYVFVSTFVVIMLTGFRSIDMIQVLLVLFVLTLLSLIIGIVQGLYSDDVMGALASVKMLFIPILAGVLPYQLLADKWQKFFYWNPFYWAYKAIIEILRGEGSWSSVSLSVGIVLVITIFIFISVRGRIQKALE